METELFTATKARELTKQASCNLENKQKQQDEEQLKEILDFIMQQAKSGQNSCTYESENNISESVRSKLWELDYIAFYPIWNAGVRSLHKMDCTKKLIIHWAITNKIFYAFTGVRKNDSTESK